MTDRHVSVADGCKATHSLAVEPKRPFRDIPVAMIELDAGTADPEAHGFRGQLGLIRFRSELRLPRHIHLREAKGPDQPKLLPERILVLNGVALVELNGSVMVIAPETLVDIAPGVPHTWTACPPGISLPDGSRSDGSFLMVYNYAEPTSFAPVAQTATVRDPSSFERFDGDLEEIRFPAMTAAAAARCPLVWENALFDGALTLT